MMEKVNVNLDLEKKLLEIEGNCLRLDERFFGATIKEIFNSNGELSLSLIYKDRENLIVNDETKKISNYLNNFGSSIEVNSTEAQEEVQYPFVDLNGYMKINISA